MFKSMRSKLEALALVAFVCCVGVPAAFGTDSEKRLFDRQALQISTGTATVNSATADYSTWQPLVTIAPDSNQAMEDVKVVIDLAQASTGFAAVYTSGTITVTIQRKVDGTNWRTDDNTKTTAISGTNSAASSIELNLGVVGPAEGVRLAIKISTVSNTNVTIPYLVYYRSGVRATITPAA